MVEQTVPYATHEAEQPASNGASAPALSLRDRILARRGQSRLERVDVPGWADVLEPGEAIYVKAMSGTERDKFEDSLAVIGDNGEREMNLHNFRAKLVARTVVDARGQRLFTPADVDALGQLAAADLQVVFNVAQRLAGMSKEDVKELSGKSEADPSDDSTFD